MAGKTSGIVSEATWPVQPVEVGFEDDLVLVVDGEGLVEDELHAALNEKARQLRDRHRVRLDVEGESEGVGVVEGQEGPIPDHEGLHLLLEGDPVIEGLLPQREITERAQPSELLFARQHPMASSIP